jgi:hypothetical protein
MHTLISTIYIATGRPYHIRNARSMVTNNTSASTTMIAKIDENKACDLVFCVKRSRCVSNQGDMVEFCYCCGPDPKHLCYGTRNECWAHCPFCKT